MIDTDQSLGKESENEAIIGSFMESLGHDNIAGSSTNIAWNDQNQLIPKQLVNSVVCVNFNYLPNFNLL